MRKNFEIAKKRLELTYSSAFLVKDLKKGNKSIDTSKNYSLENLMKINGSIDNDKDNLVPQYGVHYTPNGKLSTKNIVGEPIRRKITDIEPYIAWLYIDVDGRMGESSSKEELLKNTLQIIQKENLQVSHILETNDGYHLYIPIKPLERDYLGRILGNKGFEIVESGLADMFDGGDKNTHKLNSLMRLPCSLWCKNMPPFQTKLYKLDKVLDENRVIQDIKLREITSADELELIEEECISAKSVIDFYNNIKPTNVDFSNEKEAEQGITVNQLQFPEVFKRLEKYPREYNGKTYVYRLDGNYIKISENGGQSFKCTDGYKLNRQDNYVNNFSFASHDINERPRGGVFAFLYHYFNQDIQKLKEFLLNEFSISLEYGAKHIYNIFKTSQSDFQFTSEGVFLNTIVSKKGSFESTQKLIMNAEIEVRGIIKTNFELFGETKNTKTKYIFHNVTTDEDILVDYKESVKKFNSEFGCYGLRFRDTDKTLIDLFDSIDDAGKNNLLMTYKDVVLNGYYNNEKVFVYGNRIFDKNGDILDISLNNILLNTQEIVEQPIENQTTVSEFCNKIRDVFSDRESMLASCGWLTALCGNSFWMDILGGTVQQVLIPGMFLTGITRSGKSTMINILKEGAGMHIDARKYSIAQTTFQPLKQAAQDCLPLHLEEYSQSIGPEKEGILRDILNQGHTERGQQDGSNITYKFKSPIVVDGEVLPRTQSVANRFVCIHMFKEDIKGTQEILSSFKGLGYLKNFISTLFKIDKSELIKKYFSSLKILNKKGIVESRTASNYSFLLCTNWMFNLFDENDLLEVIINNIGLQDIEDGKENPLAYLLSEIITVKKVTPVINVEGDDECLSVPMTKEYISEYNTIISNIIKIFGRKHVYIENSNLILLCNGGDQSEANKNLYEIISTFKKYCKGFY